MGIRKLKRKLAVLNIMAIASVSFGILPAATANGVDIAGNRKCSDGTAWDPDIDNSSDTYFVYSLAPNPGFAVAQYSGSLCIGSVEIVNGVTEIEAGAFENGISITSVSIPNTVTSIGAYAFYNNYGITELNIPDSVISIGNNAFQNIGINDLFIPDSVTSIGNEAFAVSVNLNRVQIGSGVTSVGTNVFSNIPQLDESASIEDYSQTVFYCGNESSVQNANFGVTLRQISCGDPGAPSLNAVEVLGENSVRLSFTAPTFTGAGAVTQYKVSIRDSSGTELSTQSFTPSPAIARGGSSMLTVVSLTAGTPYRFSLQSIKLANSVEYGSYQSYYLTATTTASSGGGGTGGGDDELRRQQEAAAAELRRQQEAAAAAKQKQDQELREILSLVPTIAGLAQGIAGLGNSLLLPKKCVKGKLVKNVKAGAKCPKGYKVRK